MSMTPAEVDRKINQLDNDVQSIYEMLSAIQGTQTRHTNRLLELAVKIETLEAKVDAHDARFDAIDQRFDGVDQRFDGVDQRFDGLDQKMDTALELLRAR
jgi:predicted  nucleic acid-binding Zn-ribbon protein